MKVKLRNILLWVIYICGVLACWYQSTFMLVANPNNEGPIIIGLYEKNHFYWYRDFFGFIILAMVLICVFSLAIMKLVKIPEYKMKKRHFKALRVLRAELIYLMLPLYYIIIGIIDGGF